MTAPTLGAHDLDDPAYTASPGRLVVMLYERLVLDLTTGEAALRAGDRGTARDRLMHAQEIVIDLRASLDLPVWDGALGLAKIYGYLLGELIGGNVNGDADRVAACRTIVEPLLEAWRRAAMATSRDG